MVTLLTTTITASFFDSLNPSAIAQQMVLQAAVKKKRHIWFFILGISLANFTMGLAVYYGVAKQLSALWEKSLTAYPMQIRIAEIVLAAVFVVVGFLMIRRVKPNAEQEETKKVDSLKPMPLFVLGATFCLIELTSALPYFGFLAFLTGYQLPVPAVMLFIMLYTFIYSAPLILIYFGYNKLQGTTAIVKLERVLGKVSAYILPAAVVVLSVAIGINGVGGLM